MKKINRVPLYINGELKREGSTQYINLKKSQPVHKKLPLKKWNWMYFGYKNKLF